MSCVAYGLERTTYAWDNECGLPCIVVSSEGLQMSAVPRPAPGSGGVVLFCPGVCICICFGFCFTGQPRTVQEYVRVRVQSPAYIGYSPADDLSVDCQRMGFFVSDTLGRICLNKVYETRGSERVVSH